MKIALNDQVGKEIHFQLKKRLKKGFQFGWLNRGQ